MSGRELEGYVLETTELDIAHTWANIAERLGEVPDAYDIPNDKRVAGAGHATTARRVPLTPK